jgi:hypothetical protein
MLIEPMLHGRIEPGYAGGGLQHGLKGHAPAALG